MIRTATLIATIVLFLTTGARSAVAQATNVAKMVEQKSQWSKLAEEGRKLHFEGRFQGRAADSFRLEKFEPICRLPGNIKLPDRMREGQRLELTGKFVNQDGKLSFLVSRLIIRDTDREELTNRASAIPANQPDQLLAVANEFAESAAFYNDKSLKEEIRSLRTRAVEQKRKQADGDAVRLRSVRELGESLEVDQQLLNNIHFELLIIDWRRPDVDLESLITEVKKLEAWDRLIPEPSDALKSAFKKDAVASYDNGSADDRLSLHRILYVAIRMKQIQKMLKTDGSNGLILADLVRREFPGETALVASFEESEVAFQLSKVESLTRQEMQQLSELLTRLSRKEKIATVVEQWMRAQERRFSTESLEGILRTADEHLFVAETWKQAGHQDKGIELLKQGWAMASQESPADANQIAERLKRLGWEHLNGAWLTTQQVQMLPKDDVQLAIREGRVVRGMTVSQVIKTLGQPARISRLGSSRSMKELWIYDSEAGSGFVVRFRRSLVSNSEENLVDEVSRIAASNR